jgi:hypothetical protein
MSDLWLGAILLVAASGALCAAGWWLARGRPRGVAELLGLIGLAALVLYWHELYNSVTIIHLLPFSHAIVSGNWFLPIAAYLAGVAHGGMRGSLRRRTLYALSLSAVGVFAVVNPIWGRPPACLNVWRNGVCLQSNRQTCSAACAATVLSEAGIAATEGEMADLCLTRNGTLWIGLYRGLRCKTDGTPWTVRVFESDAADLPDRPAQPMVLSVGLPRDADVDSIYIEQFGWRPGEFHSVVYYGRDVFGRAIIGDPGVAFGREHWLEEDIQILYRGRGMQLERTAESHESLGERGA